MAAPLSRRIGPRAAIRDDVIASDGPKVGQSLYFSATGLLLIGLAIGVADALLVPRLGGAIDSASKQSWTRVSVFIGALIALLVLLVSIGVGVTGKKSGVLWSNRNTYSLSRLQVVLWSWLVLASLLAAVICRAWGWLDTGPAGGLAVALNIYIPSELLTVMGISVTSGAAVPAILSIKAQGNPPPQPALDAAANRVGSDVRAVGRLFVRSDSYPPLIADLFQSDDAAAAGTVDMSKVQQFAVTLILWGVYLAMMALLFYSGASGQTLPSTEPAGTTALPPLSQTFVYLLGISHAGYLAYKAAPIAPASGNTDAGSLPVAAGAPSNQGSAASPVLLSTLLTRPRPPVVK